MKLLPLLAHLGIWPFEDKWDCDEQTAGARGDEIGHARQPIVVPEELRSVVVAARWPSEYARRTTH